MRSKRAELLVGCFIVLGVAALVYLAVQVSGLAFSSKKDTYQVVARFDDIAGLTSRAKVSISGVTVGSVESITFDKDLYMALVTMNIHSDVNNIPTDSSIAVLTSGLLGEKYLGISIGADDEMLKNGSEIYDTQSALVLETLISQFCLKLVTRRSKICLEFLMGFLLAFTMLSSGLAWSNVDGARDAVIDVVDAFRKDIVAEKTVLASNPAMLEQRVNAILEDVVDFDDFSKKVMGKYYRKSDR